MDSRISFEVLSQPIVPNVANIPYVQQGFFIQISNTMTENAIANIVYNAAPAFVESNSDKNIVLKANYIDGNGDVINYTAKKFLQPEIGFAGIEIPAGATFIFGVQYINDPTQSSNRVGSTPQDGLGARGYATVSVTDPNAVILPTIRQVFQNFDAQGVLLDLSEAAYAVPLVAAS